MASYNELRKKYLPESSTTASEKQKESVKSSSGPSYNQLRSQYLGTKSEGITAGSSSEKASAAQTAKHSNNGWATATDFTKSETGSTYKKRTFDFAKGQKEIDDLEAELKRLRTEKLAQGSGVNSRPYAAGQTEVAQYTTGYGITNNRPYAAGQQAQRENDPTDDRIRELEMQIAKKKQDFNLAKQYQKLAAYDDTVNSADFDQYDDYVESNDTLYNWINNPQFREEYEAQYGAAHDVALKDSHLDVNLKSKFARKGYDRMSASEIAIYNYYYAKSGKKAAQKYLDAIQERLNARAAEEMYSALQDNTAAEIVFGAAVGVDQFGTNVANNFRFKADYIPQSAYQIASGMVRADLADDGPKLPEMLGGASLAQVAYDAVTTGANMAPSILVGVATGVPVLGTATMGLSAAGGAYQQALNEGYDKNQARGYSMLVGASEMAMEKLLGGISAVGGNALGRNAVKNIANADTALKAIGRRIGGSALSEFGEEYLQEVLDPVFSNIMLKTDKEVKLISAEAIYSGILGMLTGAFMEAPFAIYGETKTASTGRKIKEAGGVDSLAKIGNTFAADTVAYKLAGKVNENTGAYTIGQLLKEVGATLTEQNVNEIAEALMKDGVGEIAAKNYAKAFAYVVEGGAMPDSMVNAIEADTVLAKAAREVLIDSNTTWNQRTQGYNEVLRKLAMDKVTGKKSGKVTPANDQQMTGKLTSEESTVVENADESRAETAAAPRVKEIVSMKNGKMKLRLEDGSEVDSGDASYSSDSEALVYETVAQMTNDVKVANVLIDSFHIQNKKSALDAQMYAAGIDEAFRYGKSNIPRAELASSEFASKLTPAQQEFVYRMGQRSAGKQVAKNKATVKKSAKNTKEKTAGKVHFDRKGRTFDKTREASLKTMEQLAAVLGTEFYVYESYVNKDGQRVYKDADGNEVSAPNGFYDPETGAIHIDLNAGAEGNGTMIFTVAHELTHFIQHWSDDKFKVLANFLVKQYGEKDVSVSELVQKQIDKAKRNGRNLTWDEAYEEMVADSMESMLTDGNVVQMMADLKQQDKTLWQKICDWFKNLADDLKELVEAYKGYKPDSPEGKMVADMQDTIVILESIYADALSEASENFQSAGKVNEKTAESVDISFDEASGSVAPSVLYSERTWTESDYVQERDAAAKEIAKAIGVSEKKAKDYIDSVNSIAKMIADDRTRLDYFSSPNRSSFVSNVEYGGSFDFSTLCKKRRLLTGTFTAIQKALPNTALTANEILDIRNRMKDAGLEVSCGLCYVEGSRANMGQFAKEFLRLYKQYYPDAWQPNMADVNTPDGIEWVRINHPECYEQYEYFWNHYGTLKAGDKNLFASQQKPKLYQLHTEYRGEILKKFKDDDNVEEKNLNGGIRLQSFSDFEIVHLIDTMQIIMDMSRVGLAGQAYTKVTDFAWALGDTGLKINLSLIAKGVDENGKLIFDDVEGMPIKDAMKLRDRYSKNVGTILVAFNDEQLKAAMADKRVDFIIPFHRSQWKKSQYSAMGLPTKTKDYTFMQNEKFIKPQYHEYRGRMVKDKATNYMPNEYWDFSKSGKENAEAYLQMCARNNKRPKFYKLLQDNGDGSYSLKADGSTDGYWKLLIDFKMYDNAGNGSPQQAVKPEFNMTEATRMLNDYSGGHSNFPVAQGIVDEFVSEYKDSHRGVKFSDRDSDGRQLTKGQQEFFKDSKARDENGSLVTVYHTSPTAGFYEFSGSKGEGQYRFGEYGNAITYFTDSKDMSASYAPSYERVDTRRRGKIGDKLHDIKRSADMKHGKSTSGQYEGYANITRPYIVDAEGRKWNDIPKGVDQEKYDSVKSITDEEKNSLLNLYGNVSQGSIGRLLANIDAIEKHSSQSHIKKDYAQALRAYKKIPSKKLDDVKNLLDSGFSEESIKELCRAKTTTNDVVFEALEAGTYDGVIIKNVIDYGGFHHKKESEYEPANLYVTFSSEQFKAWDNTEPTKSKDIRYSDRDPAAGRVNEVLQNENAKLKEDVQYLKDLVKLQKTVTGGTKFTKTSVEAMAGNLMKANNVKGNKQELAKLLNDLYEYIAKGEELSWDGVKEMAQPAVDWLRKNTVIKSELSQYAREILHDVRTSRISLDESQTAEAAYRYGSYNDYRKAMMGSVIISKDGVPLDIQWQEWASTYPDIFDAETTASDMPNALADAISSLRNSDLSRAEYAYHADMIEQDLLQQVYDGYWRVSTLYTVADVKQREINALKGKHRQKMNDLRQFHREKTDQLKQEHRDEVKRIRKEYREDSQKKQQEIIQRYQDSRKRSVENRNKTAMRHKIQNVVKELNSLLLTNDKKRRVPDNLKKAVAAALDLVNMDTVDAENRAAKYADLIAKEQAKANPDQDKIDSYTMTMENILRQGEKMGQRIKELHAAYEEIQNSDDPDIANAYDPVISGAIQELSATIGNTSIKNMTMEQLSDVYDVYRAVLTRVRDANKAMAENIRASIEELAKSTIREVRTVGGSKKYRISNLDAVRKFDWDNMKPVYAMERIGSSTLTELFNNVRAGEDTWAKDVSEAREYYLEKSKKYGYDKWDFDKKYRFESNSGIPFELTLEQILSLYAYSKREQAADHLRIGGFVFDSDIETYMEKDGKKSILKYKVNTADAHQITPEIMADIIGKLSKEQTGFVDEMQDYLSTVMGAKGNEVTSKMYGVKLFKEKFYFPLKSAKQFMFEQNEVSGEVRIKNSGFTNKVVAKANNPVILSNFMDVWSGHVNDMSMYHAFTLPLEDFNRVFNYNSPKKDGVEPVSVKGTIQNAYGPAAASYVKQLITDLNGGARTDSTTGVINKLTGMFKKGAVFASLSVVVQQPSAIARAAALIDTKYFIGPRVDQKRHKYLWEEVKKYAPVAIIKEMGYFDTNMGKSTQDFITGKEYSGIGEKAKAVVTDSAYRDELLSKAPALADEYAWCGIWAAVKRETKAKHPSMDTTSEAFLKLCGKRFTEVITKTQVYDSVLARSANMRSKDTGMKMATAFMAEPTTSINMIEDAIWKAKRGDKKYAGKAIGAVIASQILNAILVSFVYAGRDDDEDETYAEKYIGALTGSLVDGLNAATYIPFIKDIVSIMQGYDVERSDMAVVSDLWNAWKNLKNDKVSPYRKVENFAGSIAQIFGLPVKNIMRDVRGIYNTITNLAGAEQTTGSGVKYAIGGAIAGKTVPDKEQLYKARLDGDKQHAARVAARYDDEDSANAAVRAAIKDSFMADEIDEATAVKHMVLYAGMDGSEAHWTMDAWKYRKKVGSDEGYGKYGKFHDAVRSGKNLESVIKEYTDNGVKASTLTGEITEEFKPVYLEASNSEKAAMRSKLISAYVACDMEREDAEKKLESWDFEAEYGFAYSDRKETYLSGKVSKATLVDILIDRGYDEEDAEAQVEAYEWEAAGFEDVTTSAIRNYNEWCEPVGIPKSVYLEFWRFDNSTENDVDKTTGKPISYSAVKKIMAYINSLNLTDRQKDALAKSTGWADKTIKKYKLW